jgi:hypothetical protein
VIITLPPGDRAAIDFEDALELGEI